MRRWSPPSLDAVLSASALALVVMACASDPGPAVDGPDGRDASEGQDVVATDPGGVDTGPPVTPRAWAHRGIGGISMGAVSANIALEHPGMFDLVGALGGYIEPTYLVSAALRLQLGGFCDLETLESRVADLDDRDAEPPITCGPEPARRPWEVPQDFDHLHFDTNGATFDRGFYMQVFQSLTMAFGNFTTEPTGRSPYLPLGLDFDWLASTSPAERCSAAPVIDAALSYNAEYNPEAAHPVIAACDHEEPVTAGLGGADFDPAAPDDLPTDILLAIDIDGDGERDLGEPLLLNARERFDDVGVDGCANPREDGAGGCLPAGAPDAASPDPNGDDYDWLQRPDGPEANDWWDDGEPYRDLGLDGVAGTGDPGEDDGEYSYTSAFRRTLDYDASRRIAAADLAELERMDFYFDAGIRDPLHAVVGTRHTAGWLNLRVGGLRTYTGIAGSPGALLPDVAEGSATSQLFDLDLSAEGVGRHLLIEYGDPDPTPEMLAEGDGGHVGTGMQALNRLVTFLVWAASRFPDPDTERAPRNRAFSDYHSWWSPALGARRGYQIALPPGYDTPERADKSYPTLLFLHGLGQEVEDLAPAGIATSLLMQDGSMPKMIVVFPDGSCCERHTPTGRRECACRTRGSMRECVDPDCRGPEETCEIREIPRHELVEECNGGSLYMDLLTDRWGEPRDDLGYASSVVELATEVDRHFRTRARAAAEAESGEASP